MDKQRNNIVLIGLMGCGKTTIGKKLAADTGFEFVDTDQIIEAEQGCPIKEVFKFAGEEVFRSIETKVLTRFVNRPGIVMATGGGIVMATGGGIVTTDGNMGLLKQIGTVVYIEVDLEVLAARVSQNHNRPKIDAANPLRSLTEIYEQRKNIYEQADLKINSDGKTLHQTCRAILGGSGHR